MPVHPRCPGGRGRGGDHDRERRSHPWHGIAAADCQGCPLYRDATQTVFGRGTSAARLMLVGEQPGDQEDVEGEPFVGPAGRLLHRAFEEAGLGDEAPYVTNVVKHFKFTRAPRGKRRIHSAANLRLSTRTCWCCWAARRARRSSFRVGERRGVLMPMPALDGGAPAGEPGQLLATVHPSAVLRADDRECAFAALVADLSVAATVLE